MSLRYNPQSYEKQLSKSGLLSDNSAETLSEDLNIRVQQLLGKPGFKIPNPIKNFTNLEPQVFKEYGSDAVRLALLTDHDNPESLYDSAYNRLSHWFSLLNIEQKAAEQETDLETSFLLTALMRLEEQILERNKPHAVISMAANFFNRHKTLSLSYRTRKLLGTLLYPFVPVFAISELLDSSAVPVINEIYDFFPEYLFTEYKIEKSSWQKIAIKNDPAAGKSFEKSLLDLPRLQPLRKNGEILFKTTQRGILICLA
ncbi:MAG: hypothetical protein GX221_06755 [Candidatus Riflebacteria bacterium]|nr:hypothetical protein [Candidatus Riflebacteria bacterium]